MSLTLTEICHHEAGHAVSCWYYGGKLELVATGTDGNSLISYQHSGFSAKLDYRHAQSKEAVLIILSGLSAMLRIISNPWDYEGCYKDIAGAEDLMKSQAWVRPDGYDLNKFYRDFGGPSRTFCFNTSNWQLIKALSKELMGQKRMRGQAIAKLLEAACPLEKPERALPWQQHSD